MARLLDLAFRSGCRFRFPRFLLCFIRVAHATRGQWWSLPHGISPIFFTLFCAQTNCSQHSQAMPMVSIVMVSYIALAFSLLSCLITVRKSLHLVISSARIPARAFTPCSKQRSRLLGACAAKLVLPTFNYVIVKAFYPLLLILFICISSAYLSSLLLGIGVSWNLISQQGFEIFHIFLVILDNSENTKFEKSF